MKQTSSKQKVLDKSRNLTFASEKASWNKLRHWTPIKHQGATDKIKTIFILGASKSGKSSLEKILGDSKKTHSFYEYLKPNSSILTEQNKIEQAANFTHGSGGSQLSGLFYGEENFLRYMASKS